MKVLREQIDNALETLAQRTVSALRQSDRDVHDVTDPIYRHDERGGVRISRFLVHERPSAGARIEELETTEVHIRIDLWPGRS